MNKIVVQPANKTKFHLSFLTLLVGLATGSHAAIAQTGTANQNQHRPFDRILVTHQHLSTQGSDHRKNYNLPNGFIISRLQMPNPIIDTGESEDDE